ncbi:response regulator transcription factor [Flavivirga spongiicola]|uniref:Response regulator transcription factor n=1 Tax=Flavivirga spongiicola TaxID=421621 RepID=A0ABU7XQL8_9FLAO|nr:response regulator transcription factor [Flavivirga sp. MEBiC05379]MDO5977821.1 response regulator transcription factor [Flavivirga sp. MEBiC05379]
MEKLKVLVADDHYIVRLGLKILINSFEGFEVTLDVENGQEALDNIEAVDYLILDLEMPVVNGVEALKRLKQNYSEKKVVLLTNCMDIPTLIKAKKLKPNGFLFKDGMHEEIKICLNELKKGNYYTGRNCKAFFERHKEEFIDVENLIRNLSELTKTEIKILYKISENLSTSEIAEALFNSPKTIDNHRTNIAKKLDVSGYNNLQAIAIKNKLLIESLYNSTE